MANHFFFLFSYRRRTYGRIVRHVLEYDRCVTVLGCRYTPTEINVIKLCTALVVCICFVGKRDAISSLAVRCFTTGPYNGR